MTSNSFCLLHVRGHALPLPRLALPLSIILVSFITGEAKDRILDPTSPNRSRQIFLQVEKHPEAPTALVEVFPPIKLSWPSNALNATHTFTPSGMRLDSTRWPSPHWKRRNPLRFYAVHEHTHSSGLELQYMANVDLVKATLLERGGMGAGGR